MSLTVKETIDENILQRRQQIEALAKNIKALLREAIAHHRAYGGEVSMSPSKLQPEDFQRMDDEMGEHSRIIDQYLLELQKSSFIAHNTSKEEN